jgi:hypothetical protein
VTRSAVGIIAATLAATSAALAATSAPTAAAPPAAFSAQENVAITAAAVIGAAETVCATMVGNRQILFAILENSGLGDRIRRNDAAILPAVSAKMADYAAYWATDPVHQCALAWRMFGEGGTHYPDLLISKRR